MNRHRIEISRLLAAQRRIVFLLIAIFAIFSIINPAPIIFIMIMSILGAIASFLLVLSWRHSSNLLFFLTVILYSSAVTIAQHYFNIDNQIEGLPALIASFICGSALFAIFESPIRKFARLPDAHKTEQGAAANP